MADKYKYTEYKKYKYIEYKYIESVLPNSYTPFLFYFFIHLLHVLCLLQSISPTFYLFQKTQVQQMMTQVVQMHRLR